MRDSERALRQRPFVHHHLPDATARQSHEDQVEWQNLLASKSFDKPLARRATTMFQPPSCPASNPHASFSSSTLKGGKSGKRLSVTTQDNNTAVYNPTLSNASHRSPCPCYAPRTPSATNETANKSMNVNFFFILPSFSSVEYCTKLRISI